MGIDVSSGIGEVAGLADDVVKRLFPDKTAEEQAKIAAGMAVIQGQLNANTASAQRGGIHFRDGAGWVCVASFAFLALKAPIEWAFIIAGHPLNPPLPPIDTSITVPMLLGLLGLGGMHMYQQVNS